MKYLRSINESEIKTYLDFKDEVDRLINWDMVKDIKDMALEDIDEGYKLAIRIEIYFKIYVDLNKVMPKQNENVDKVGNEYKYVLYDISFDHGSNIMANRFDNKNFIDTVNFIIYHADKRGLTDLKTSYRIALLKTNPNVRGSGLHKTMELMERINDAYPKEMGIKLPF